MSKQIRRGPDVPTNDVHNITDARVAHSDEMRLRMIKYSVSMGIRMVCLVLVFFVEGWLQWVVIAGAVFLPYFAVIIANGGSDTSNLQHSDALLNQAPAHELESRGAYAPESGEGVLQGELIDDEARDDKGGTAQ